MTTLFIRVASPERFKCTNPQQASPVCAMEHCADGLEENYWQVLPCGLLQRCHVLISIGWWCALLRLHWHYCLSLTDLQTEFLAWKGSALFIISSGLEEVCDFVGLYNYNEGKKKGQKEKSQVPVPRPLASEIKHDRAGWANPEKMGWWVPRARTFQKGDRQITPYCLCIMLENSNNCGEDKVHPALIRGSEMSSQVVHCQSTLSWISGSK